LKKRYPKMVIKLLGVHGCYQNCFYASRHSELPVLKEILDQKSKEDECGHHLGDSINTGQCHYYISDKSDEIKRGFIRPEDVWYYEKYFLCDIIKIAYRDNNSALLKEKYKAYFRRAYRGNLFEILSSNKHYDICCDNQKFPQGFINKVMKCDKNCDYCDYCAKVARKTTSMNKYEE
jgi:hypothetical protein